MSFAMVKVWIPIVLNDRMRDPLTLIDRWSVVSSRPPDGPALRPDASWKPGIGLRSCYPGRRWTVESYVLRCGTTLPMP